MEIVTAFDVDVVVCPYLYAGPLYSRDSVEHSRLRGHREDAVIDQESTRRNGPAEGYGSQDLNSAYWRRSVPRVEHQGEVVPGVECYVSTRGAALFGNNPFGLRSVDALGSPVVQRGYERDAWARLAAELGRPPGTDLCELARDHRTRSEILAHFEDHRLPPAPSGDGWVLPSLPGS